MNAFPFFGDPVARGRAKAARTARGPLADYYAVPVPTLDTTASRLRLLAIDIETTGLDPARDQVLSVGFVPVDGPEIVLGAARSMVLRGVAETHALDAGLVASLDARKLDAHSERLTEIFAGPAALRRKETTTAVHGPGELLDAVFAQGRKGIAMQRYKGLGEMNAEQLWETTLDPNVRSLLQVRVNDATDADGLFTRLMGDEVEPRRDFIQENALSVANLDI